MRKSDIKATIAVVAGVFIAGYAMYAFRDVGIVDNARRGFGG